MNGRLKPVQIEGHGWGRRSTVDLVGRKESDGYLNRSNGVGAQSQNSDVGFGARGMD